MTSLMSKPWMLFATGPSVSTSPPTLKVAVMATVLSFTARYVFYHYVLTFAPDGFHCDHLNITKAAEMTFSHFFNEVFSHLATK